MSTPEETSTDYMTTEVGFWQKLRTMQLWNYAIASGLPGIPGEQPPVKADSSSSSATATAAAPAASNGLLKLVGATGLGAGLLTGGVLLSNAMKPPATPIAAPIPIAVPAPPNGQVTIGINPDGTLFDPNAGATK